MRPSNFDTVFQDVSGNVLRQIFGDCVAGALFEGLKTISMTYPERCDSIDVFSGALRQILGSGSLPIERLILIHLYSRFELSFEQRSSHDFTDYVKELKQIIESGV